MNKKVCLVTTFHCQPPACGYTFQHRQMYVAIVGRTATTQQPSSLFCNKGHANRPLRTDGSDCSTFFYSCFCCHCCVANEGAPSVLPTRRPQVEKATPLHQRSPLDAPLFIPHAPPSAVLPRPPPRPRPQSRPPSSTPRTRVSTCSRCWTAMTWTSSWPWCASSPRVGGLLLPPKPELQNKVSDACAAALGAASHLQWGGKHSEHYRTTQAPAAPPRHRR